MKFVCQVLTGFGQIMLQNNALTGLLFLIGIAYGSINMALAALLATASATLFAKLLKLDEQNLNDGLYGFSAALVGVALLLFFKVHWLVWVAVVSGGIIAALIQHLFINLKIPVFTLPFILVIWLTLFLGGQFTPELLAPSSPIEMASNEYFAFSLLGFGQVIFQGSLVAGAIFFIAVFINSPIAALYALAASTASGIIALLLGVDTASVAFGLLSFNAVLTAIVFAGSTKIDGIWVLITVLLTLAISMAMLANGLVQLTFPFVAASMIGVFAKKLLGTK